MISELTFIREYNSFWAKLLPGADYYIRAINSVLSSEIFDKLTFVEDNPSRRALVNNVSFSLFGSFSNTGFNVKQIDTINFDDKNILDIVEKERKRLWNTRFAELLTPPIDDSEKIVVKELCKRLYQYYNTKEQVIINPYFNGVGILNSSEGDVFYKNTLSEVKAGVKNFKIQDLRQLYTYLALNQNSISLFNIEKIELFNPRTGYLWTEDIEEVSQNLAGLTTSEIIKEIIFFISEEYRSL